MKLGRLKRDCSDMGTLMAALVKYADSDSTKDPASDDERTGKGKKNVIGKGPQHNPGNQGGSNRKADGSLEFVDNASSQVITSDAKGGPLPEAAGQARRWSNC